MYVLAHFGFCLVAALMLTGCDCAAVSRRASAEERLAAAIDLYQRYPDVESTFAIIERLRSADVASLQSPELCFAEYSLHLAPPPKLKVTWIADVPEVDAVRVLIPGASSVNLPIRPEDQLRNRTDHAPEIVVFTAYFAIPADGALHAAIVTPDSQVNVALVKDDKVISNSIGINVYENPPEVVEKPPERGGQ